MSCPASRPPSTMAGYASDMPTLAHYFSEGYCYVCVAMLRPCLLTRQLRFCFAICVAVRVCDATMSVRLVLSFSCPCLLPSFLLACLFKTLLAKVNAMPPCPSCLQSWDDPAMPGLNHACFVPSFLAQGACWKLKRHAIAIEDRLRSRKPCLSATRHMLPTME